MSSAYNDIFIFSFPILIPFSSLFYLVAMARTSNTMLNRRSEGGDPCLILDFNGKAFGFSP